LLKKRNETRYGSFVYCDNVAKELSKILAGQKTMIIRGASGRKIPHSRVFKAETLYFMEKGTKKISAKARVTNVLNYVKLTDEEITAVIESHNDKLVLTDKQKERWHKRMCLVWEFAEVEAIEPWISIIKAIWTIG
jgi:hypothetical protein